MSQFSLNTTLLATALFSCSLISIQTSAQVQCQDAQVALNAEGLATLNPESLLVDPALEEGTSLSVDRDSFDCSDAGAQIVTLTITDAEGEQSTCTSTVTIQDKIAPNIEVENITVYLSEAGTVSADMNSAITLLEDNCSTEFDIRFNQTEYSTNHLGYNEAKAQVKDEAGNMVVAQFVILVLPPTADDQGGLPDIELSMYQESFDFYPNPAESIITLDGNGVELGTIVILNATGKEVLTLNSEEMKSQIEINELPSGMYFIECNSKVKRFIKK